MSFSGRDEPELERLKRALRVHLEHEESAGGQQVDDVLEEHADLADLLAPMLGCDSAGQKSDKAEIGAERYLGDFAIGEEIARGGMGIVYEARQLSLSRRVALKVLHPGLVLDDRAKARFVREARLAAGLDHPGITRVIAAETSGDIAFYAMELVDGVSLDRVLQALVGRDPRALTGTEFEAVYRGLLPTAKTPSSASGDAPTPVDRAMAPVWHPDYLTLVIALVEQIAEALEHAHEHGIIHRDVKPGNVILRRDGTVALTDFGLAREAGNLGLTMSGDYVGTPYYSSPEQVRGAAGALDARSDVFSLGVMLYELLTLQRPFEGATGHEVRQRIADREPAPPQRSNRAIKADLAAVVLHALEKNPRRRYAAAATFAQDLRWVAAGRPVSARPVRPWVRWWRWHARNPIASAVLVVLLLAVVGASALAWQIRERGLDDTLQTARLLTQSGNAAAEPLLWRVHQARDDERTRWALAEFYRRFPIRGTLGSPGAPIWRCEASGDGQWLAVTRNHRRLEMYAATDLTRPRFTMSFDFDPTHLIVSHDGTRVALVSKAELVIVEPATGTEVARLASFGGQRFCDGGRYLVGFVGALNQGDAVLVRFDVDAGRELPRVPIELTGNGRILPLSHREVVAATVQGGVRVLHLDAGSVREEVLATAEELPVGGAYPVPGRDAFVVRLVSDGWMFERIDGRWIRRSIGTVANELRADDTDLLISAFPGRLVASHYQGAPRRRQIPVVTCDYPVVLDSGVASKYADGSVRVWDISREHQGILELPGRTCHAVAFVDERTVVVGGGNEERGGRVTTLRLDHEGELRELAALTQPVITTAVAVIPGTRIVVAGQDGGGRSRPVRRWLVDEDGQLSGGEVIARCATHSLVARHDGRWLAAAGEFGSVGAGVLWSQPFDADSARTLRATSTARRSSIAFVGEDLVVAAGARGEIDAWRLEDPELRGAPFCPREAGVRYHSLVSTETAQGWLLAAGRRDGRIAIWRQGQDRARPVVIACHHDRVFALAFARVQEGLVLISGDYAGRVVVSDPLTGTELCELRSADRESKRGIFGLAMHPDQPFLVAVGEPRTVEWMRLDLGFDAITGNAPRAAFEAVQGAGR